MKKPASQVRETEQTRQPSPADTVCSQHCKMNTSKQSSLRRALSKLGSVIQAFLAVSLLTALIFSVIHAVQLSQFFRGCTP